MLGSTAGSVLSGGVGPTQGSGLLGYLTGGSGAVSGGLGGLLNSTGLSSGSTGMGTSLLNSYLSSKAMGGAVDKMQAGLGQYSETGQSANAQLAKMLGLDEDADEEEIQKALEATPGYQFERGQGEQAINRSLGSQGKVFSGEALKAAGEYNTGLASKYYQNYINDLAGASSSGQNASAALAEAKANAKLAQGNAFNYGLANYLNPVRY